MKVGFTGTQEGMTKQQRNSLLWLLDDVLEKPYTEAHHGDCIGADAEFHEIMCDLTNAKIHIHPPSNKSKRAFKRLFRNEGDVMHPEKPYLQRNHDIVDAVDVMIATPKEKNEQMRSGTWETIRYSWETHKRIFIIEPDGHVRSAFAILEKGTFDVDSDKKSWPNM